MKSKFTYTIFILIFISANLMAQPLPPSSPTGNPVPVGNLIGSVLLIGGLFLIKKKK